MSQPQAEAKEPDAGPPEAAGANGPQRILITGSSGLVGSALTAALRAGGHHVVRLVRGGQATGDVEGVSTAPWAPDEGQLDARSLSGCDAVVHLAGGGIADARWTPERKRLIRDSRVDGTALLARTLAAAPDPPRVLVSASATGYYGDRGDRELDEGCGAGFGFLASVAEAWEQAAAPAEEAGIRVIRLRIGVVLTPKGGALARMLLPFKAGFGGPLGSGRQFWSWITLDDLVRAILHAVATDDLSGPVNAVAPGAVRNSEFASVLGRVLRRPAFLPVPAFVLKLLLGEMARELLLSSTRVKPARLAESGFRFRHGTLEPALRDLLDRPGEGVR